MNKRITYILLSLIVFVGLTLRVTSLSVSPPSLNWDEAAWGYNAYSISTTLRDEYGVFMPVFTRSFDEYKPTLPLYLMVPTIKLLGLNEVGVRLPSALFGVLGIAIVFFLTKELFKKESISLAASFLYALEPWSVHLSRVYHDGNIATVLYFSALYFFLKARKNAKFLLPSAALSVLSMYTYNANKVLVPVTALLVIFLFRKDIGRMNQRSRVAALLVFMFGFLIFLYLVFLGQGLARAESTNIFLVFSRTESLAPQVSEFLSGVFGRYLSYFSPANLFLYTPSEPSTVVPGFSIFYPVEIVLLIAGVLYLFKEARITRKILALALISPFPAAITWNWFQPGRTMILFTWISIFCGAGLIYLFLKLKSINAKLAGLFLVCASSFFLVQSIGLWDAIRIQIPAQITGNWQPGFRESMKVVQEKAPEYGQVVIDTPHAQPYIFVLFYTKYPPAKYLAELDFDKIGTPRKVYDFGKYVFRSVDFSKEQKDPTVLYVLWRGSGSFGNYSDDELSYKNELKNVDNDTIVTVLSFKKK